ncbi:hypothetical protein I7I53_03790 [Histoplasma capsulatum var. duboisii H88]|uniref:Uncharacterized protein n=1 Tax=Ajellomyces capsulatus (strain H88) TaxID=544711 RepID=A0A8A1LRP5_AJEC8|nr:hypothetical protein I7I53_03790 [Histoplasma capsulatum var. duboisii H88]
MRKYPQGTMSTRQASHDQDGWLVAGYRKITAKGEVDEMTADPCLPGKTTSRRIEKKKKGWDLLPL